MVALRTQLEGKKTELEEYVKGSVRELVAQGCKLDEVGRGWLLMVLFLVVPKFLSEMCVMFLLQKVLIQLIFNLRYK